jgi:serine/threonine protein kinase
MKKTKKPVIIDSFDLQPGRRILNKYEVVCRLGEGWEGEVYRIVELRTGIDRAAKLFYPHRNPGGRMSIRYAQKLHKLRHCPIVVQYFTEETFNFRKVPVTALISEYVEGERLDEFLDSLPGKRLSPFEALHLLHSLVKGLKMVHLMNDYHGDLHAGNVIVLRYGLTFDLKVFDPFHLEATKAENRQTDICDIVKIFYDSLGGARYYTKQPQVVKYICSGLKQTLILKKFRTLTHLKKHLETLRWD